VALPAYEPAGFVLQLDAEGLCRMTLIAGSTGSGKSTLLNGMLGCLLRHCASDPEKKIGLLVMDPKQDDTLARITAWLTLSDGSKTSLHSVPLGLTA
jgi:energy-coupling factor transporter ATP-binding protein EcfA2